jgi:hypothetical protein
MQARRAKVISVRWRVMASLRNLAVSLLRLGRNLFLLSYFRRPGLRCHIRIRAPRHPDPTPDRRSRSLFDFEMYS